MLFEYLASYLAARKFRDYRPQPVTYGSIEKWLNQFDKKDRENLVSLLKSVIYVTENESKNRLVKQNKILLERLARSGIPPNKVIYVQIDEAGSSSPVMLNMLKEAALLERQGCHFIDSHDVMGLGKIADTIGDGAIVYIDDFVGSGTQFCTSRDFLAQYIVGTFSEFLLLPCICEEALYELGKRGVEALAGHVHTKVERPLHENSTILDTDLKNHLIELCYKIDPGGGLGYKKMATMVVFYRNTPNSTPVLLRGNVGQNPYIGVLPRTQDLPT